MQIKEYTSVKEMSDNDIFLIDGNNGTRTINASDAANTLVEKVSSDTARNALSIETSQRFTNKSFSYNDTSRILTKRNEDGQFGYSTPFDTIQIGAEESKRIENRRFLCRAKNLGSVVTDEQWEAISSGTFKDMFVGDYWRINGIDWHICDIDYWQNTGDTTNNIHHLVIMPNKVLKKDVQMNPTSTTEGGYLNSDFRKNILPEIKAIVTAAFPEEHLYVHKDLLCNTVINGQESGNMWVDSDVEIPDAEMIYGIRTKNGYNNMSQKHPTININQLAICSMKNLFINIREDYWVKNVESNDEFAYIHSHGLLIQGLSKYYKGIRPVFGIC